MLKALIIDDVMQARAALRADLSECCPDVDVVGEADGVESGLKLLAGHEPDVVFLDIRMNDGTGFDLLEQLGGRKLNVIFTTAYDDQAIRAFRYSAVDYLLKPVDPEDLKRAVSRLEKKGGEADPYKFLLENFRNLQPALPKKIALNTQEKLRVVSVQDILRCESDSNYTYFFLVGGEKILVTRTMKEFEEILTQHEFYRVHHSHLVNREHIREFVKGEGGYIVMDDGSHVPVSTRRREEVLKWIQGQA